MYCEHLCETQLFFFSTIHAQSTHSITEGTADIHLACTLTADSLLPVSVLCQRLTSFLSPFRKRWFFFTAIANNSSSRAVSSADEEVLWFLSPLFCHLCIDDVCPQGPGGLRLTEIIKSKYVSPWRRMCVWYANTGFRSTCGEEKMLWVLVGGTHFNLKRSSWWWRDGNMKSWTSEVFGAATDAPPNPPHSARKSRVSSCQI